MKKHIENKPNYNPNKEVNEKKRTSMIGVRGGFSEKIGIHNFCIEMQFTEFDQRTRVILNNRLFDILKYYFDEAGASTAKQQSPSLSSNFCESILSNVFAEETILETGFRFKWSIIYKDYIGKVFDYAPYNEVLDIIWYCCKWLANNYYHSLEFYTEVFNNVFQKECVGYRFVNGEIAAITNETEILEVTQATQSPHELCAKHIQKALSLFSNRENPDYKNCIKESICAVEFAAKYLLNNNKITLSEALQDIKKTDIDMHPTIVDAINKLYAYACDAGGVRHSEKLQEKTTVGFDEAKMMLVTCSSFANYLLSKSNKKRVHNN